MEINKYLVKLIQVIKDMEELNLFSDAAQLTRTEFRLLQEIAIEREKGKEIISSELARRLGVTRSAVSQIVTKLEKEDIVKRTAAPDDKKIAYVCLSDRALGMLEEQTRYANAVLEQTAIEYGEEALETLLRSYDRFVEVIGRVREQIRAD